MAELDFPVWLRIEHWVNVLFLTLLIRSGIEILATHPKLYWRDDSRPGTEWARFTRKTMPTDKLYDTLDEEEDYSPVLSLPGHKKLGMGRHWHFLSVIGWVVTGATYYILLFATGQWHRYIPYSWSIFPTAWNDLLTYLSFNLPPLLPGQPFDGIQKLSYAFVIFLLAPFQILTGIAQSPALEARFPRYVRLWGGRQTARSLHFFGLLAFLGFLAVHLMMVGLWGWGQLNALMIFGDVRDPQWAIAWSLVIIAAIVVVHVAATVVSLKSPRTVQRVLGALVMGVRKLLLTPLVSKQDYSTARISPEHRVNGKPPDSDEYKIMAVHNFVDWKLEVGGLVESPMTFTLADLRARPEKQTQRVLHNCIQGWTSIGEWSGMPMRDLVDLVKPLPQARYLCLLTMQDAGRDEPSAQGAGQFYEVIDLSLARHPEALLAYEMNGGPLPIEHGAPLRLRLETQVGFKMAKWIERIEVLSDYSAIGEGMGGWREDNVFYDKNVEI
ncbi:molybdopterin-dependent oxidoreductase [Haloactinomyces albus]|uniref:DMSO/TMAO reductase YedYZ molybdopterin-dependent catalytic subunit/thiosulfate reductase cytochrome b subunit n=1 Tax=Haloactinomyces albus TaxID=1352928 RepID=A0AAE4CJE8_9ACTN|nr:molybdopterin-dependent oxidoreductase [Haloactinomyces albus]MDR7299890.1 DMSO/TMAO reductase YedYZ molybdopterin-dependent catalytic subunit/thiosulfate reductase cytochrome b subunit [Haloactinomyces albus]